MNEFNYFPNLRGKIIVMYYDSGKIDIAKALKVWTVQTASGLKWCAEHVKPIALNDQLFWPYYKHRGDLTCRYDSCCGHNILNIREATPQEIEFYTTQSAKY